MNKNFEETYFGKKIDNANILNIETAIDLLNKKKVSIVTGVTGQDGSLMAEYLLNNTDHIVFGGVRRLSVYNHCNIKHLKSNRFHLINFDLTDSHSISRIIEKLQPDYFINFAAQSFVASSWDFARQTWQTNSTSVLDILEAIRLYKPSCRLYQAGSSEEFGNIEYSPQNEKHPLKPRSPYGASKAASRQLVKVYRESYNLYAIQGWLFNHEGPRRGEEFVTRKITKHIAKIFYQLKNNIEITPLELGNIDAKRDWSDAEDFMDGVWRMLNQEIYNKNYTYLKEYILSSGESHSIREFVEEAFKIIGINGNWEFSSDDKKPINEIYCCQINNKKTVLVKINSSLYRPAEVERLLGDSKLAREELGWEPKVNFYSLVEKMIKSDIQEYEK